MKKLSFLLLAVTLLMGSRVIAQAGDENDGDRGTNVVRPPQDDPDAAARFDWIRMCDPSTGLIPPNMSEKERSFAIMLPHRTPQEYMDAKSTADRPAAATNWTFRGPTNVGGRTRALGVDVTTEGILLAGGVSGAMYRSSDGGASWKSTTPPSALHNISCVTQDRRQGRTNTWYYGTGEWRGNSADGGSAGFVGNGIFKSTDKGVTWSGLPSTQSNSPQSNDLPFDYVFNIVTDHTNQSQDIVYAAGLGKIQRSSDGGINWSTVLGADGRSRYTDVAITSTGVLYATLDAGGRDSGIWRSVNGLNWTNITPAGWPEKFALISLGVAPSSPSVVYVLASTPSAGRNNNSFWKYTYLSGNGAGSGGTWSNRSGNLPTDIETYYAYCQYIAVKPDNPNMVFVGALSLYRSADGFATTLNTTDLGGGTVHVDQHSFGFDPTDPNTMYIGNDGGVYMTNDAGGLITQWSQLNNGYATSQFYTCAIEHNVQSDVVIGGLQDNGTQYTDATSSAAGWRSIWGGDGAYCAIASGNPYYYASYQNGEVYRLTVSGGTRLEQTKVSPTGGNGYLFINPFSLDPADTRVMYLPAGRQLWRNSDLTGVPSGGTGTTSVNWTVLTNDSVPNAAISTVSIAASPRHRIYYGTSNGQLYRCDNANSTSSFPVNLYSGKGLPSGYVSCITIDPHNSDSVLVVFSNYNTVSLFLSTNAGASWTPVAGNLEQDPSGSGNGPSCRWASIVLVGSGRVYLVGTSTGLYSTSELSGSNTIWTQEDPGGIGNVIVDMLDARQSDGYVVAATHGSGLYSTHITSIPLQAAALVYPADNLSGVPTDTTFRWQQPSSTVSADIQVASDASFTNLVVNANTLEASSYHVSGLTPNTVYYWRVRGEYGSGPGPWSSVSRFTTGNQTDVREGLSAPVRVKLTGPVPSPVQDYAAFEYSLTTASEVRCVILDVLGREIREGFAGHVAEGTHVLALNLSELGPGTYLMRVSTSAGAVLRAFTIVR